MNLDLAFYWRLVVRRLPVMMALFLICVVSTTVTALKLPPTYETSAQLLVEEAQIPDSMLAVVQVDANQQLQVIERRLLTRANLLDVARQFNVLENMEQMTPDTIVERMRNQSRIRRTGGRGQASLMTVSFEARTGRIAANVVNEYVNLILQENSDFRMRRAESTLKFFEREVERLGKDLDLKSAEIVTFKNANQEALPSDLTYRQNRQALLQERQSRLERDLAALDKQRRDMIAVFETTGGIGQDDALLSPEERQLLDLQLQLDQALAIYSENHPRVVLLRNQITKVEKTVQGQATGAGAEGDTPKSRAATMMDLTLLEFEQRAEIIRQELQTVVQELEELEESIKATASNAISLDSLERDYASIQARYNEAERNLNQARVNERIEVSAQGQRVSVLEAANVPQDPSGPKRIQLIALGVVAGLGLAVGFFLLLEVLNRSIRRPAELQARYGITPIAVIPYMESGRERFVRRTALASAVLAVVILVPAALYYIDTAYMPLDVLASKIFTRLGLT